MAEHVDPGPFSVSLSVADLAASQALYEALGFEATGGDDGWQVLQQGAATIGLRHIPLSDGLDRQSELSTKLEEANNATFTLNLSSRGESNLFP